jgi:hypothetical protein
MSKTVKCVQMGKRGLAWGEINYFYNEGANPDIIPC